MRDILETVDRWLDEGRDVALATVAKTWGSAPRREGSKLAIAGDLSMIGSVSGGCVEGAVVEEALAGLRDGKPRLLKFGVADDLAWEVGLTCGGSIEVYVEPLDGDCWRAMAGLARDDRYGASATVVAGERIGAKLLLDGQGEALHESANLPESMAADLSEIAVKATKSGIVERGERRIMVDCLESRPHLILVGGVHVSIPLAAMAREVGFRVSIVDPRSAFASEERFPHVENILHSYPDKALPELGLDGSSYLAVLTHDPKIDDKALLTALPAGIPYVGVLSSGRTHKQRVARLKDEGLSDDLIGRIHTPIGVEIGAGTPEEIAVCILAEVIAVRNGARDALR